MKTRSIFAIIILISVLLASCAPANTPEAEMTKEEGAAKEGAVNSYGMSDDWVNLGYMWQTIEDRYDVVHTDIDMTSAEQITRLDAEKDAPVLDVADIGYDFLGTLLEKEYAMTYKSPTGMTSPLNLKILKDVGRLHIGEPFPFWSTLTSLKTCLKPGTIF